jgi:hypothetical protein
MHRRVVGERMQMVGLVELAQGGEIESCHGGT